MATSPYLLCLALFILASAQRSMAHAEQREATANSPADALVQEEEAQADQERWLGRIGFGGKLGPSFSTFVGRDAVREFSEYTNKPGLTLGGFVSISLNRWVSLQPEVLFTSKGPRIEEDGIVRGTFNVGYIDIPFLARITFPASERITPYLLAGPTLSILLSVKLEDPADGSVTDRTDRANSLDLGLLAGIGAKISLAQQHALVVEGRYNRGLSSIPRADDEDLKNRVFAVMLGYQYSLSAGSPSPRPSDAPILDESESVDTDRDDVDDYEMMD